MPEDPVRLVVGVALLRDHPASAALAARRVDPPGWEFPGGKVEPGESPEQAAVREVAEELGCRVEITGWLAGRVRIRADLELVVATGRVVAGEPRAREAEHAEVRWVRRDEIATLDWLPADVPFVAQLVRLMEQLEDRDRSGVEILVDERDHAESVAGRLRRDGYDAVVVRGRFHGEDDEEDQPWAVRTDAPLVVAELTAEEFDDWVEELAPAPRPATPGPSAALPLPDGPRRVKGHWRT